MFIKIFQEQNEASIKLLEKFGFEKWGTLPKVANFNGAKFDHLFLWSEIN